MVGGDEGAGGDPWTVLPSQLHLEILQVLYSLCPSLSQYLPPSIQLLKTQCLLDTDTPPYLP